MIDNIDNDTLFKIGVVILLVVNSCLLIYMIVEQRKNKKEGWSTENSTPSPDYGQKTFAGCSCVGYGYKNNKNMPPRDDSNLYAKTIYQGY